MHQTRHINSVELSAEVLKEEKKRSNKELRYYLQMAVTIRTSRGILKESKLHHQIKGKERSQMSACVLLED